MASNPIGVGIVGMGTIGSAVAKLLAEERELLARRLGAPLELTAVCDLRFQKGEPVPGSAKGARLLADFLDLVKSPEVDIVVELMGGTGAARQLVLAALEAGKPVVTANKHLLAVHGEEIFGKAEQKALALGFEASVAGGVPILRALREGIGGDEVTSLRGIVNGTANYILSEMTEKGESFERVLARAQRAGYAEADPTFDIEGIDAAHKLTLLASLAFGARVAFADVYAEGIGTITPDDIGYAKAFGYRIKLLALARHSGGALELRVHPAMLPERSLLAQIGGALNGIEVESRSIGQTLYTGLGAGGPATSGAVVSDLLAIARSLRTGGAPLAPPLLLRQSELAQIPLRPMGEIESAYYLRFSVRDRPGVLAKIAGHLGDAGVSIAELQQPLRSEQEAVPVVLLTHRAREDQVRQALPALDALDVVTRPAVLIRVEDERL